MTNAEAIEYIKKNCYGEWCEDDWREAIDTAIKALEKQIPVKPMRIDKNKEFDGNWLLGGGRRMTDYDKIVRSFYAGDDVMEAPGNTNFNVEQVEHYAELEELYELISR